jgi:phospholipid/cholesterol/gamma-HCH transport system ATP-binding protein
MVELRGLTMHDFVQDVDLTIPDGTVCKVVTETDLGKDALLDALAGLRRPDSGAVILLGSDIYGLPPAEAISFFREVGVVWRGGGLVSNLRVWENIALPADYHLGIHASELEERVGAIIECLGAATGGLMGRMASLPANLLEHERTSAGLVRAMLMEPHLLIYDSVFEGLSARAGREMAQCIMDFHRRQQGRTSVFVTSDERSLEGIEADVLVRQDGTSLEKGG